MALNIFLDANIILDFLLKRDDGESRQIFLEIGKKKVNAYTSPVIIHIVGHLLKKHFAVDVVKRLLLLLLNDVKVIDTTHGVIVNALSSSLTDIEDALQYYTALHHKADILISRDNDFIKKALPSLPIYSAKQFISIYLTA